MASEDVFDDADNDEAEYFELTPADFAAGYDASIIVRRGIATVIDFIVLTAVLVVPPLLLGDGELRRDEAIQKTGPSSMWIIILYYPLMEGLLGYTIGKFIVGIRVVDAAGCVPGVGRALVRTATRFIEVNPIIFGILAWKIAAGSKWKQRWGDMIAMTFVLTASDAAQFTETDL